jgi:hypothetical protein
MHLEENVFAHGANYATWHDSCALRRYAKHGTLLRVSEMKALFRVLCPYTPT